MKRIKISESATQDLIEGYKFYEEQEVGVGDYFLTCLYSDIDSLLIYLGIHQLYFGRYYRQLSELFPFAIYYTFDDDFIYIKAVLDCRRKPSWIRNHLKRP